MGNNGHKDDLPGGLGLGLAGVPLVGQPATIAAWFLTMLVQCHCTAGGTSLLLAGQLGSSITCPACRKSYVLRAMHSEGAHASFQIEAVVTVSQAPHAG